MSSLPRSHFETLQVTLVLNQRTFAFDISLSEIPSFRSSEIWMILTNSMSIRCPMLLWLKINVEVKFWLKDGICRKLNFLLATGFFQRQERDKVKFCLKLKRRGERKKDNQLYLASCKGEERDREKPDVQEECCRKEEENTQLK